MIVDPLGNIVAGPVHGIETMLYADAPYTDALLARRGFDAVGHYGRGDIFSLALHGVAVPLELNGSAPMTSMSDRIWQVGEENSSNC